MSYEEEDTRIHASHMRRRIHACHMRRRIYTEGLGLAKALVHGLIKPKERVHLQVAIKHWPCLLPLLPLTRKPRCGFANIASHARLHLSYHDLYIYIHIHTHTYIHTYIYTHTHTHTYIHIIHTHTHTHTHTYTYI